MTSILNQTRPFSVENVMRAIITNEREDILSEVKISGDIIEAKKVIEGTSSRLTMEQNYWRAKKQIDTQRDVINVNMGISNFNGAMAKEGKLEPELNNFYNAFFALNKEQQKHITMFIAKRYELLQIQDQIDLDEEVCKTIEQIFTLGGAEIRSQDEVEHLTYEAAQIIKAEAVKTAADQKEENLIGKSLFEKIQSAPLVDSEYKGNKIIEKLKKENELQ